MIWFGISINSGLCLVGNVYLKKSLTHTVLTVSTIS